jgi:dephospho-CoA kinase
MEELIGLHGTEEEEDEGQQVAATAEARALWSEHCDVAFDTLGKPLVAVEAAVLVEAGWSSQGGSVWSTFVDRERAIERMQTSRGASRAQAESRLAAQLEVVDRLRAADVGIDSSGSKCRTWAQLIIALHGLELSA